MVQRAFEFIEGLNVAGEIYNPQTWEEAKIMAAQSRKSKPWPIALFAISGLTEIANINTRAI